MLLTFACFVALSTTAPTAPASTTFLDGRALRRIEPLTGKTARYVDVATGRATTVTVSDSALLQVRDGADIDVVSARLGLVVVRAAMPSIGVYVVRGSDVDGVALTARVQQRADVDVVQVFPNLGFVHTAFVSADDGGMSVPPNDTRYAAQFYLDDLGLPTAWAQEVGDPDVVVAVVDNGCDLGHLDLVDKLLPGHDVITDDEDPGYSPNGAGNEHGTACAGLVAASTDNDRDIAGACPLCRLRCTRMLPANSEPVPLDVDVRAFDHAFEDDVAVVSNSWGFIDAIPVPQVLQAAIVHVQQNGRGGLGAVVVFASGNDAREIADDELLAVPGIIGVGAVNNLGELAQFSNRGRSVDVVAPTGTVSTDISGPDGESDGDVTFRFGGTSSAAPLVAGIAGLIVAHRPTLTADEITTLLEQTAKQSIFARPDDDGHDLEYGFGLVQPATALAALDDPDGPQNPDGDIALGGGGGGCGNAGAGLLAPLLMLRRRRSRLAR